MYDVELTHKLEWRFDLYGSALGGRFGGNFNQGSKRVDKFWTTVRIAGEVQTINTDVERLRPQHLSPTERE
jgi:hypothetical protein